MISHTNNPLPYNPRTTTGTTPTGRATLLTMFAVILFAAMYAGGCSHKEQERTPYNWNERPDRDGIKYHVMGDYLHIRPACIADTMQICYTTDGGRTMQCDVLTGESTERVSLKLPDDETLVIVRACGMISEIHI